MDADAAFAGTGLHKSFGGRQVLCGVDVSVRRGEIVGLLGPSGAGKSTVFGILSGVERPDHGAVHLCGHDVTSLAIDGRARLGVGYVPQAPELFERLTVAANLRVAVDARMGWSERTAGLLDRMITAFHLDEVHDRPFSHLSGGQRRLVEIAFAVCTLPKFLLLDEPFAGLDPIVVGRIVTHIRALARAGIGILVTDHKARAILDLVERAVVIDAGTVIADGSAAAVARVPRVREVFLGADD